MNTGLVVMYGGSPVFEPPTIPDFEPPTIPDVTNPWWPGFLPKRLEPTGVSTLEVCGRCGCHTRIGEPCVVCLKADLVALEKKVDAALEELKKSQPKPRKKGKK